MIENERQLIEDEAMAYFRADLCLYSPESYTLEEKRDICNGIIEASKALLDAMRVDFERKCKELHLISCTKPLRGSLPIVTKT